MIKFLLPSANNAEDWLPAVTTVTGRKAVKASLTPRIAVITARSLCYGEGRGVGPDVVDYRQCKVPDESVSGNAFQLTRFS